MNGDGVLSKTEIMDGLRGLNKSSLEIEQTINSLDTDCSGVIEYTEFISACLEKKCYQREELLINAFRLLDEDGNGRISRQELKRVIEGDLSIVRSEDFYSSIIKEVDLDGDGEISYYEFIKGMGV